MASRRKLFVPLVVDYSTDDKIIAAGPMAELLFVRSMAFCKRTRENGVIAGRQLAVVGYGIPNLAKHASTLVEVGLWRATPDGGWIIPSWFKHNAPASQGDELSAAALKANHVRWKHPQPFELCPICSGSESGSDRNTSGSESQDKTDKNSNPNSKENGSGSQHDDESQNTPPVSSSDFDAVLGCMAQAALSRRKASGKSVDDDEGYLAGTRANMRIERGDEIRRHLSDGRTVPDAVAAIVGDPSLARWALRAEGLSHIAEVQSA